MRAFRLKRLIYTAVALMSLVACSPASRYKILSVFFDGVPNPDKETTVVQDSLQLANTNISNARRNLITKPTYVFHPPYRDKDCDDCHERSGSNRLLEPQPELCYDCHDDFSEEFTYQHGPVASGNCTACHNPHLAKNEKLLKRTGQLICLYCHESKQVFANEEHEDLDETDECTDCHSPHGGEDKFFLD